MRVESKKETTYTYKVEDSASRMDDILDASDNDYSDNENNIPSRDKLTFKNGYYVDVTSIFIDIVDSSKLTDGHKRPTLAKMYRCFLSECVAIMNSYTICKEININGDCVWGVFETPNISDVDKVTDVAAKLNSMIRILNYKLGKKNYEKTEKVLCSFFVSATVAGDSCSCTGCRRRRGEATGDSGKRTGGKRRHQGIYGDRGRHGRGGCCKA